MIVVTTWSEVLSVESLMSPNLYGLIQQRFRTLHQIYCAAGDPPLSQFCLADSGAIHLLQVCDELKAIPIESAWEEPRESPYAFIALVPVSNSACREYLIPFGILTPQQIQEIKEEYCL